LAIELHLESNGCRLSGVFIFKEKRMVCGLWRWSVLFLILSAGRAYGQEKPPESETRSGCLSEGQRRGIFVLIDERTGVETRVEGTGLAKFASGVRANVTGTVARQGGVEIFRITNVEQTDERCGPIGFSPQALREAIGRANYGIRGGIAIDPELIHFGVHAELGPVIRSLWFRPTAEFAFGEVTKVFSLNGDFAYYLPFSGRGPDDTRWNVYMGMGPSFAIVQRDFEGFPGQAAPNIDDDWDGDSGLNFFVGALQSNGFFLELKAAAYSTPNVRLYIGYTFR
jgi:hypothetical protein